MNNPVARRRKAGTREGSWQAEKSQMTRTAILEAAIRCLIQYGYSHTTTPRICEEAGVSRGAMMHHFPSRNEVIAATVLYVQEKRMREFREAIPYLPPHEAKELTREDFREGILGIWKYLNQPSFTAYQELFVAARTDAELAKLMEPMQKRFEKEFYSAQESLWTKGDWEEGQMQLVSDLVNFTLRGLVGSYVHSRKRARFDAIVEHLTDECYRMYRGNSKKG